MTRSLEQLQAASEKREAMEKRLRAKLEEELADYRNERVCRRRADNGGAGADSEGADADELDIKLGEAEERIFRLESERAQWEQRYLEETAMRQVALDASSIPKDAKIAALEKSGAEAEKVIADARVERMRQLEEVDSSKRRLCEMD